MLRILFMAGSLCVSAITIPMFFSQNGDLIQEAAVIARDSARNQTAKVETARQPPPLSGTERIRQDRSGHYVAEFQINNAAVDGLVDTGATAVAINRTTARRAGIRISDSDFIYAVSTANGETRAARAVLDTVRLGSIRVNNVEALVLDDQALDGVLIGMSFMNKLRSFEFENGTMLLRR